MLTFQMYVIEEDAKKGMLNFVGQLKDAVNPNTIQDIVTSLNPKNIDDLIQKLQHSEPGRKFMNFWKNTPKNEQVLDEGVMDIVKGIGTKMVLPVFRWILKKIWHILKGTFKTVFGPIFEIEGNLKKVKYAGILLLTYLLSALLLAEGVPLMAGGGLVLGMTLTWWFISAFGEAFIKPMIKYA